LASSCGAEDSKIALGAGDGWDGLFGEYLGSGLQDARKFLDLEAEDVSVAAQNGALVFE
jgi:hypothetical protein